MAHIGLAAMSSRRWDLQVFFKKGAIFHLKKLLTRLMQFFLHEFLSKNHSWAHQIYNHSPTCFWTLVCLAGGCGRRLWRGLSED